MVLLVEGDAAHLGWAEGALYEQLCVGGEVDDVDVLAAEFADDAVDAASLDADAGSYGVYAVVVALDGDLGTLAWHAGYALDADESVVDFGDFCLQQSLQEDGAGT